MRLPITRPAIANIAVGAQALLHNDTGEDNIAIALNALLTNVSGDSNTACGFAALGGNTGSGNIAMGFGAGGQLTTGNFNIDIGNPGVAGETTTIRIGGQGTQTKTFIAGIFGANVAGSTVVVDSNGQLGVSASSQRFKKAVEPMDKASEAIVTLKPVTFQYKADDTNTPQFGLITEQVAEVNPDLVVRDHKGEIYTVRYDAVNAMLLNEFLKEHRGFVKEQRKIEDQQTEIDALKEELKEQRALVRKISDKIEVTQSVSRVATSEP